MATPSNLQGQITCTICKNTFKSPVQLPCQHSYCIECLSTISSDVNIKCPQCNKECTKHECEQDKKTEQLISLFDHCTDGKKQKQHSTKLKFHLPSRSSSRKESINDKPKEKKRSVSEFNNSSYLQENLLVEQERGDSTILTKASARHSTASSASSTDSEKEACPICIKHSIKWICVKCQYKSCKPCLQNYPLLCKDGTANHTFVECDSFIPDCESPSRIQIVPNKAHAAVNSESNHKSSISEKIQLLTTMDNESGVKADNIMRKVTFQSLNDVTESSSDTDFKPHFRDSIALTRDKKESIEEIIEEISKVEETAKDTVTSLHHYHQYMKDVKGAGFSLIDQTEQIMMNKMSQFFNNLRKDYEAGVDEMTLISEQIQNEMEKNLQNLEGNTAILEEIIENNDTRALLDEEFLTEKCEDLDTDVAKLGKNIVQCKRAGLKEKQEWNDESKVQFEKQMNVSILTATEKEMKDNLYPDMAATIHKMKPVLGAEHKAASKKKFFDCNVS